MPSDFAGNDSSKGSPKSAGKSENSKNHYSGYRKKEWRRSTHLDHRAPKPPGVKEKDDSTHKWAMENLYYGDIQMNMPYGYYDYSNADSFYYYPQGATSIMNLSALTLDSLQGPIQDHLKVPPGLPCQCVNCVFHWGPCVLKNQPLGWEKIYLEMGPVSYSQYVYWGGPDQEVVPSYSNFEYAVPSAPSASAFNLS